MRDQEVGGGRREEQLRDELSQVSGPPNVVSPPASRLPPPELWVVRLGTLPYLDALEIQRSVAQARITGEVPHDVLLLVQHPPVVTLGRTSKQANLTSSPEFLRSRGVELFEVERGGDVTFHGPGQLVGYPIIDLKKHRRDLHWYLRRVEDALIKMLADFGLSGERREGYTGVWTRSASDRSGSRARKIASIGVHARDWVTWHGFALNITTDLSFFDLIVPCGIEGVVMTSLARETGLNIDMQAAEDSAARAFGDVFSLRPISVSPESLAAVTVPIA